VKTNICENTCEELGRAAKEEAERIQQMFTAGYDIRETLIAKGKIVQMEKQVTFLKKKFFFFNLITILIKTNKYCMS